MASQADSAQLPGFSLTRVHNGIKKRCNFIIKVHVTQVVQIFPDSTELDDSSSSTQNPAIKLPLVG